MSLNGSEGQEMLDSVAQGLASKGRVLLEVNVSDREAAEELLRWLYADEQ